MKRCMTLVMILGFLLSIIVMPSGAATAASGNSNTAAMDFLTQLNIMHTKEGQSEDIVTRESFAIYVARMLKIDEFNEATERYFNDVDMEGYGTACINELARRGLISQSDDMRFYPFENIRAEEAYKMLFCALGYKSYAESEGGYPLGYIRLARKFDIYATGEYVTVADAASMIYQAMQTKMFMLTSVSNKNYQAYTNESGQTLLYTYWDIEFIDGHIEALYGGTLDDNNSVDENQIIVDGKVYTLSDNMRLPNSYLGSYVTIFYDKYETVVFVADKTEKVTEIAIDIENFVNFDFNEIRYYIEKDSRNIRRCLLKDANIIYNGAPLKSDVSNVMQNLNKGTILVKDINSDGRYDTVIVEDFRSFVVGSADYTNQILYNKVSQEQLIAANSNMTVITSIGDYAIFDDIVGDDVVSVAKSKDGCYVKMIVSNQELSGMVSVLRQTEAELCIDNKWYTLDKEYHQAIGNTIDISLSATYLFQLDSFGEIVYISSSGASDMKYGYIIDVASVSAGLQDEIRLKLLTQEGTIRVFGCAKRVTVDGISYKSSEHDVLNELLGVNNAPVKKQIVRYVEKDGLISQLDTADSNTDSENLQSSNTLRAIFNNTSKARWYNNFRLDIKALMNDNSTLVFCVPYDEDGADDSAYGVRKPSEVLVADELYYSDAYTSSDKNGFVDVVLCRYTTNVLNKNTPMTQVVFLVDEIANALDEGGNIIYQVTGYETGTLKTYNIDPGRINIPADIEQGDLIKFYYGVMGDVVPATDGGDDIVMLFDHSAGETPSEEIWKGITPERTLYTLVTSPDYSYYRSSFQLSFGYVGSKRDNVLTWGYKSGNSFDEAANLASVPIIVFDERKRENKVYVGNINDIQTYENVGNECSRIIFQARSNVGRAVFIYK